MKTITVRGLDETLIQKLKDTASKESKSVNQLILDTIRSHMGLNKVKKYTLVHHDIDHLFGKWSKEEFESIQNKIDSERVIDEEIWR